MTEQQYNHQKAILIGKGIAYQEVLTLTILAGDNQEPLKEWSETMIRINDERLQSLQSQYLESVELENK